MEKILSLSGRIDSSNAFSEEERLIDELDNYEGNVVIDAGGLKYISSAGLRI